jgi:hypothetical protein
MRRPRQARPEKRILSREIARMAALETIHSLPLQSSPRSGFPLVTSFARDSSVYGLTAARSLKALMMTDADERLIASAAIIGDSNQPVIGYNNPAASGTPRAL